MSFKISKAEHPKLFVNNKINKTKVKECINIGYNLLYGSSKTPEELHITANFIVKRIRLESVDTYVGRYEYRLQLGEGRVLIKERRAILVLDTLRPHGKVSFIL